MDRLNFEQNLGTILLLLFCYIHLKLHNKKKSCINNQSCFSLNCNAKGLLMLATKLWSVLLEITYHTLGRKCLNAKE